MCGFGRRFFASEASVFPFVFFFLPLSNSNKLKRSPAPLPCAAWAEAARRLSSAFVVSALLPFSSLTAFRALRFGRPFFLPARFLARSRIRRRPIVDGLDHGTRKIIFFLSGCDARRRSRAWGRHDAFQCASRRFRSGPLQDGLRPGQRPEVADAPHAAERGRDCAARACAIACPTFWGCGGIASCGGRRKYIQRFCVARALRMGGACAGASGRCERPLCRIDGTFSFRAPFFAVKHNLIPYTLPRKRS